MEGRVQELAQEALDLHTDPRSHQKFRFDLSSAIEQVVDETDTLDVATIGEIVEYRENLIADVTAAVEDLQQNTD